MMAIQMYTALILIAGIPLSQGSLDAKARAASITTESITLPSITTSYIPSTTTVSAGLNHDFNPDTIFAQPGDIIEFIFYPTNHSVARAAYQRPCVPYDYVVEGGDTFFSGPKESETGDEQPIWRLTVNDTEPYFFYCSAPGSCINSHMVGAINPNENFTLQAQKAALADVKFQLSPGETLLIEDPATPTATVGPAPTEDNGNSSTWSDSKLSSSDGNSLPKGALAGIAIGGAAILAIAIVLVCFCGRKKGIKPHKEFQNSEIESR